MKRRMKSGNATKPRSPLFLLRASPRLPEKEGRAVGAPTMTNRGYLQVGIIFNLKSELEPPPGLYSPQQRMQHLYLPKKNSSFARRSPSSFDRKLRLVSRSTWMVSRRTS